MDDALNSFTITLVAGLIGGLVAASLAARANRAFRPPPPRDQSPAERYPRALALVIAAHLVVTAWISIGLFLLLVLLAAAGLRPGAFMFLPPGIFVAAAAVYFALVVSLRCNSCSRRVLLQSTTTPPYAEPLRGLNAWGSIVVRVVSRAPFRCMYCGQRYHVGVSDDSRSMEA